MDEIRLNNLIQMAKNACSTKNFDEAITHINRIHEYDLQNFEAWRIKAIALCGKLSVIFSDRRDNENLRDIFTAESLILCWKNALTSPQITNKTFAEDKIFDDFVQNYLALLYSFIKIQKESSEPFLKNHADRLIFLFRGLNLIFQTSELQYFKNKIPKFTPRYSAQLMEYVARNAFIRLKSVKADMISLLNIERKFAVDYPERKLEVISATYLLEELLNISDDRETSAYICELLAFSNLYYPFSIDEYELIDELSSNVKCRDYYNKMISFSQNFRKKYDNLKETKRRQESFNKSLLPYIEESINFAKSENDKMLDEFEKLTSRANNIEYSLFSFLRFYEIDRLRSSANALNEKIQNNEQIIEKLRAEQGRLENKNLLKLKAKLRGVLDDASKLYPEFGKWSRDIAEYK